MTPGKGSSDEERRRYPRIPVKGRCWCEGSNVTLFVQMGNLSERGAFVRTATPLDVGSTAKIRIVLPDSGEEVEVVGKVVWNHRFIPGDDRPAGMGIEFTKVDEVFRNNLKNLLKNIVE